MSYRLDIMILGPREVNALHIGLFASACANITGDDAEQLLRLIEARDAARLWAWLSANFDDFAAAYSCIRHYEGGEPQPEDVCGWLRA